MPFEAITLTGQHPNNETEPLDIGAVVESMLFYGKTTVVANFAILLQMYKYFGGEYFLRLLSEEYLEIVYLESFVGIYTEKQGLKEFHGIVQFSSPQHKFQDKLYEICVDAMGRRGAGKRLADKLKNISA